MKFTKRNFVCCTATLLIKMLNRNEPEKSEELFLDADIECKLLTVN